MASEWIKARQTKYGAYLFLYVVVILAVLFAANWLAKDHNKSFDVTTNKRFSLSDQTKKVVGDLKKPLTIYYFDRKGSYDAARDMLDRYQNLNSNVKVRYVDPEEKPDLAKLEGVHNFGDIIIDNGIKKETAKGPTEEELTGAIIREIKTGTRSACFLQGSGEHRTDDTGREGYSDFKSSLEKNNYTTSNLSLLEKTEIPKTCTVVIVGGPQHDYSQPMLDALKTYVTGGGHALFNFDGVASLPDGKIGDTPQLAALVKSWGITPNEDLLLNPVNIGLENIVVQDYESHPISSVMKGTATIFPEARSLDVASPAQKLFSSLSVAVSRTKARLPIEDIADTDKKGVYVLGAAATVGSTGRIVVVGSSLWASNQILGAPIGNHDLLLNTMNWLTADEDLISIRPKEPEDRRLNLLSSARFFWISVVLLPLAVIFSGVSIWWKRR
jgi:ABC-type uncharacterized transport system involved in gliding motility auxiliary subunit